MAKSPKRGAGQCSRTSILLSQHDRQHARDDRFSICALDIWLLIQVDLEKYLVTIGIERAEVMFFMRVVGVAEIVIDSDGLDDAFDGFLPERSDARCDDCDASKEMLAKLVVE